ncbi:hypothetical protein [Paractinoplanes durhamensis]|uniref:hypothetical protein n=1 Tax=Paractinoplanes durhamensis TaxID=113563 RepID=UPI00363C26F9
MGGEAGQPRSAPTSYVPSTGIESLKTRSRTVPSGSGYGCMATVTSVCSPPATVKCEPSIL